MCDKLEFDDLDEEKCKNAGHLIGSLKELVNEDETIISLYGITFEQLRDFFATLKHHFNKGYLKDYQLTESDKKNFSSIMLIRKSSWCLMNISYYSIFNDKYFVIGYHWAGGEVCPLHKDGGKRISGSIDWFFLKRSTGEVIHIADLLFHQIVEHHFFQEGRYRVDPEQLIKFFDLKSDVDYETTVIPIKIWKWVYYGSSTVCEGCEKIGLNEVYYSGDKGIVIYNEKVEIEFGGALFSSDLIGYFEVIKTDSVKVDRLFNY